MRKRKGYWLLNQEILPTAPTPDEEQLPDESRSKPLDEGIARELFPESYARRQDAPQLNDTVGGNGDNNNGDNNNDDNNNDDNEHREDGDDGHDDQDADDGHDDQDADYVDPVLYIEDVGAFQTVDGDDSDDNQQNRTPEQLAENGLLI